MAPGCRGNRTVSSPARGRFSPVGAEETIPRPTLTPDLCTCNDDMFPGDGADEPLDGTDLRY